MSTHRLLLGVQSIYLLLADTGQTLSAYTCVTDLSPDLTPPSGAKFLKRNNQLSQEPGT